MLLILLLGVLTPFFIVPFLKKDAPVAYLLKVLLLLRVVCVLRAIVTLFSLCFTLGGLFSPNSSISCKSPSVFKRASPVTGDDMFSLMKAFMGCLTFCGDSTSYLMEALLSDEELPPVLLLGACDV